MLKSQQPNKEGLTFKEWLYAAAPDVVATLPQFEYMKHLRREPYRKYTEAWLAGEDPTEWRATYTYTPPAPYVLTAKPSLGRGLRAHPEDRVALVREIPAKSLVGDYAWDHLALAALDIVAWPYAHRVAAYGNTADEAAENLKKILIDDLEGTGLYSNPKYQPHYDKYTLVYRLIPHWQSK